MQVLLVLFRADGTRRDFPVRKRRIVLGRSNGCDMRIPLSSVSREHCEIVVSDDAVTLRDLGSSNGTYRNDNRVLEAVLEPGDRIRLGPVHFVVVIDGKPSKVEPRPMRMAGAGGAAAAGVAKAAGRSDKARRKPGKPADDEALPLAEDEDETEQPAPGLPAAAAGAAMADAEEAALPVADDEAGQAAGDDAADALAELQRHLDRQDQAGTEGAASAQESPAASEPADELPAPASDGGQDEAPLVAELSDQPADEPRSEALHRDARGAPPADEPATEATEDAHGAMPLDQRAEQATADARDAASDAVTVDADQPATASSDDTMDPEQEDVVAVGEDEEDEVEVVMEDDDDEASSQAAARSGTPRGGPDAAPRSLDSADETSDEDALVAGDDAAIDRPDTPSSLRAANQSRPEAPAGVAPRYSRGSQPAEAPEVHDDEPAPHMSRPEAPRSARSAASDEAAAASAPSIDDDAVPVEEAELNGDPSDADLAPESSPSQASTSDGDAAASVAVVEGATDAQADEEALTQVVEDATEATESDEALPVEEPSAEEALTLEPVEDDDPIAALARMAEAEQDDADDNIPLADDEDESPPPKASPPKAPPPKPKTR